MLREKTKMLLLIVATLLIGYDFIPFFNPERGDTISEVIRDYAKYVTLPLTFGVLMGHFFAPVKDIAKQAPKLLITILISSICFDLVNQIYFHRFIYPLIPLLLGIPIGMKYWQQRRPYV